MLSVLFAVFGGNSTFLPFKPLPSGYRGENDYLDYPNRLQQWKYNQLLPLPASAGQFGTQEHIPGPDRFLHAPHDFASYVPRTDAHCAGRPRGHQLGEDQLMMYASCGLGPDALVPLPTISQHRQYLHHDPAVFGDRKRPPQNEAGLENRTLAMGFSREEQLRYHGYNGPHQGLLAAPFNRNKGRGDEMSNDGLNSLLSDDQQVTFLT